MFAPLADNLGTANLLELLKRLRDCIERFNDVPSPEAKAIEFLEQIKDLIAVTRSIDDLATKQRRYSLRRNTLTAADAIHLQSVYTSTRHLTQDYIELIEHFHPAVEDVIKERDSIGYATPETELTGRPWYEEAYNASKLYAEVFRMLFSCITLLQYKNDTGEDGNLSAEAITSASTLQYQAVLVESKLRNAGNHVTKELRGAVAVAKRITLQVPPSLNKHFVVGRSVKSFYTGRKKEMAKVVDAFADTSCSGQRRFVIYGLGGSGKSELALKYAEEQHQNFWGVFLVDASTRKSASASYYDIAKIGGVEPNEKAAKNWLATRVPSWLLIIDNADGDEVLLDDVLPTGAKGCVLITSRNPMHKSYGTAGERYLELLPMETEEANDLILKAAEEPSPWTKTVKDSASIICQALGFLPLALVHAGKAILLKICTWDGYIAFFDRHTDRIRRERSQQRDRSFSGNNRRVQEDDDSMNVFSSYEILYRSLQDKQQKFEDAIELLQLFSYFHHQNIRIDVLVYAATNPLKEEKAREEETKADEEIQRRIPQSINKTWSTWLRELLVRLSRHLDGPPPLPAALKNTDFLPLAKFEDEVNDRLHIALVELVKRSLIMSQDRAQGRYYMHPLVHKWVRERAEMATSQQALWCQVATTVLARSISFPPLGDTEYERDMRRELLPHIIHVRGCEGDIRKRLQENRARRRSLWPAIHVEFGRHQALESARFSRVYSECGLFHEALQLQSRVRDFAVQALGEAHPLAIRITLFQAGTLYELSRASEATKLQRRMYDVCLESLGQYQPLTLTVTDMLASSLCFMGQWSASLSLHQKAVEGMTTIYGKRHVNTLKAIRNLARVHLRYLDIRKSSEFCLVAWEGMKEELGETHVETMISLEDLAMTRLRLGAEYLPECHERMDFVLRQREKALGKEHPYTLLAICNLGRVKSAMGQPEEAAKMMKRAVDIAERNLGENHYGVLAGKTHYAQVLVNQGRYEEAEEMFYAITGKPQYRQSTDDEGGEHPDRLIALWYLTGCLEKQGKFQKALEICQGIGQSLREIGGQGKGVKHKFATMVQEEITKIQELIRDKKKASEPDLAVPAEI
ncbi:hypothetical protein F4818DRAFT_326973 [Hypoxylon cercidicola]|nr:hypothetical protein F4818DRAFT_326973 [Hypoxylon cercidicola]